MKTFSDFLTEIKQTPQRLAGALETLSFSNGKKLFESLKIGFEFEGYFCIPYGGELYKEYQSVSSDPLYRVQSRLSGDRRFTFLTRAIEYIMKDMKKLKELRTKYYDQLPKEFNELMIVWKEVYDVASALFEKIKFPTLEKEIEFSLRNSSDMTLEHIRIFYVSLKALYECKEIKEFLNDTETTKTNDAKEEKRKIDTVNSLIFRFLSSPLVYSYLLADSRKITKSDFRERGRDAIDAALRSETFDLEFYGFIAMKLKEKVKGIDKVVFSNEYHHVKPLENEWKVEFDSSLSDNVLSIFQANKKLMWVIPVEIVSPPMKLDSPQIESSGAIKTVKALLNFLNSHDSGSPIFVSTKATGLHFNISGFEDPGHASTNINWLMFFTYLEGGQSGMLKMFDRETNEYARSQVALFKNTASFSIDGSQIYLSSKNNKEIPFSKLFNKMLDKDSSNPFIDFEDKYRSANLSKAYQPTGKKKQSSVYDKTPVSQPIEIRGMGNFDYHMKQNQYKIFDTIRKVIYALLISSNSPKILKALGINSAELRRDKIKKLSKEVIDVTPFKDNFPGFFKPEPSTPGIIVAVYRTLKLIVEDYKIKFAGALYAPIEQQDENTLLEPFKKFSSTDTLEELYNITRKSWRTLRLIYSLHDALTDVNLDTISKADLVRLTYYLGPKFDEIMKKKLAPLSSQTLMKLLPPEISKMIKDFRKNIDFNNPISEHSGIYEFYMNEPGIKPVADSNRETRLNDLKDIQKIVNSFKKVMKRDNTF